MGKEVYILLGTAFSLSFLSFATAACLASQYRCANGNCIPSVYRCDYYNDCGDNSDEVQCVCYLGEIRLFGGPTAAKGTVELCIYNSWSSICGIYWTSNDASVVCRQLGFIASTPVYNSYYGSGSTSYYWTNVAGGCYGNETNLLSCHRGDTSSCSLSQMAGVQCLNSSCPYPNFQCGNGLCVNYNRRCDGRDDCRDNSDEYNCQCYRGDVKLVGGNFTGEGTVEVCDANKWGTVCDTLWSSNETKVVCKQLGYNSVSVPFYNSFFGPGNANITWRDVGGCRGTESSILSCGFTPAVQCDSASFAGVRCFNCSPPNYFMCKNDHCIAAAYRCDGTDNCKDGSDEINCGSDCSPPNYFMCKNDHCIAAAYRCDGTDNCKDGSDEINCGSAPVVATAQQQQYFIIGGGSGGFVLAIIIVFVIILALGVLYRRRRRHRLSAAATQVRMSSLQSSSTSDQVELTARSGCSSNENPAYSEIKLRAFLSDEKNFADHVYDYASAPPEYRLCVTEK